MVGLDVEGLESCCAGALQECDQWLLWEQAHNQRWERFFAGREMLGTSLEG